MVPRSLSLPLEGEGVLIVLPVEMASSVRLAEAEQLEG
jgi:hypothetical protein